MRKVYSIKCLQQQQKRRDTKKSNNASQRQKKPNTKLVEEKIS